MSILQSIQINPTDCKLVLAEIQMDPTAFHTPPGPNRPGAVSTFKFRVIGFMKREIVQISGTLHDSRLTQRWAPNGYNPNPIDLSLGISVHRTDLKQEVSEPDRVSGLDRAETPQGRVENEHEGQQTERVGLRVSNTRPISIGYRSGIGF